MDHLDDVAGSVLWTVPPADEEVRKGFIEQAEADLKGLRELDLNADRSTIDVPLSIPGMVNDSEQDIEKGIAIIESMIDAVRSGSAGQGILLAAFAEDTLYGFTLNLESGTSMRTSAKIDPKDFPEGMADAFTPPLVMGILNAWAEQQNAVIAWGAVRIMCDEIVFPETIPGE